MVNFDHHWLNEIGLLSFLSRASRGADENLGPADARRKSHGFQARRNNRESAFTCIT